LATGISASSSLTYVPGSRIDIVNSGDVQATARLYATGISARARGPVDIDNSGDVRATTSGRDARGIIAALPLRAIKLAVPLPSRTKATSR
jgi:hypothetical protein